MPYIIRLRVTVTDGLAKGSNACCRVLNTGKDSSGDSYMSTWPLLYENFKLVTSLSKDEVRKRIEESTEPRKLFRTSFFSSPNHKLYEGEVRGYEFNIRRIIRYRNTFRPVIIGRIVPEKDQTKVHIAMRPSVYGIAFGGFVIVGLLAMILYYLNDAWNRTFVPGIIGAGILMIFIWLMASLSFRFESRRSRKFLAMILLGKEVKS